MDILFDLILWPLVGLLQAVAGILWPSKNIVVRRLQRYCFALLICAVVSAIAAIALAYLWPGWHVLVSIGATAVFLLISGAIGHHIETICKNERPSSRSAQS